ncbi:MAG: bacillithiol system redox-active protein YtxJ [Bacteroidota bacterium]
MGLLDRFNKPKTDLQNNWKDLNNMDQLTQLIKDSSDKPVMIFKHSTRCGISARAQFMLESGWDIDPADLDFYYLDLIAHRPISNEIAARLGVVHQSPQLILVKDQKAVFDTSHHMVSLATVKQAIGLD